MKFLSIGQVRNAGVARIILVALRAHGFHPLEMSDGGLPGVPNLFGPEGITIEVPESEAADATVLLEQLLKDMDGSGT